MSPLCGHYGSTFQLLHTAAEGARAGHGTPQRDKARGTRATHLRIVLQMVCHGITERGTCMAKTNHNEQVRARKSAEFSSMRKPNTLVLGTIATDGQIGTHLHKGNAQPMLFFLTRSVHSQPLQHIFTRGVAFATMGTSFQIRASFQSQVFYVRQHHPMPSRTYAYQHFTEVQSRCSRTAQKVSQR